MAKSQQQLLTCLPVAILLLVMLPSACTVPQIVMIEDTLTAEQHNDLGYVYEQKQAYELAEKEYLLAVKKREDWPVPYLNLGNIAYKRGDYKKSEYFFRKLLTFDPNNTDAMNNLANALLMQGRLQEARLLIEKALQIRHKDEYEDTLKEIQKKESLSHR